MKKLIIAIDGPAASGKSSAAKVLAKRLGYRYLDTGAMYRALTLYVLNNHIDPNDEPMVIEALKNCKIDVSDNYFFVNDEDVTKDIRSKEVTLHVSKVCSYKGVRDYMVAQQRELAKAGGVVLDGRDIGTVVFPHADLKFYQTASVEARALRRYQENQAKGINMSLDEVKEDIIRRDYIDSTREHSPLRKADDAILIDSSSSMNPENNVEVMLNYVRDLLGED